MTVFAFVELDARSDVQGIVKGGVVFAQLYLRHHGDKDYARDEYKSAESQKTGHAQEKEAFCFGSRRALDLSTLLISACRKDSAFHIYVTQQEVGSFSKVSDIVVGAKGTVFARAYDVESFIA